MSASEGDRRRADEVARLSERVAALAEAVEVTERAVAAVRRDLAELGLEARVAPLLDRLALPSDAAEELMDELDKLSAELAQGGAAPSSDRPDPVVPGARPAPPAGEHLEVRCQVCGRHFASTVPVGAWRAAELDGRSYRCPHCGEERTYETWDHFLEP